MFRLHNSAIFGIGLLLATGLATAQVIVPGGLLANRIEQRQQAFVATLGLSADQTRTWQQLQRQQLQFAATTKSAIAALVVRTENDLANPVADLHQTQNAAETLVDQTVSQHRALKHAQLAFYDQLTPDQQARVRAQLLERLQRLQRVRDALLDLAAAAQ